MKVKWAKGRSDRRAHLVCSVEVEEEVEDKCESDRKFEIPEGTARLTA